MSQLPTKEELEGVKARRLNKLYLVLTLLAICAAAAFVIDAVYGAISLLFLIPLGIRSVVGG